MVLVVGGGGVRQRIELHSAYNLVTRITPEKKRKFKDNKERKKERKCKEKCSDGIILIFCNGYFEDSFQCTTKSG